MKRSSIIASGVLHLVVMAASSIYWVPSLALPEDESAIVPVDLVTSIAEQTNIAPTVQKDLPPPTAQPLADVAPLPEMQVSAAPPPEPVEIEAPPEPEPPPPAPEPVEAPPPPPEPEVAKAEPPPPVLPNLVMPRRKPAPPKKPNFDVNSVLALLDKRTPPKPPAAPAPPTARVAEDTRRGFGAQNALTVDLKDALLSQMRACWNVPVGAPNPEQLIVEVRIFLSQDGSLARPPQLEPATRAAMTGNPYMRTAAEAALRAVNVCEPYKRLPPDKYDAWREIVMIFDPSKMLSR